MSSYQLSFVIFNGILLLGTIALIVMKRKQISKYQEYVYEKKKPTDYLMILAFSLVVFIYLFIFFNPVKSTPAPGIKPTVDGESVKFTDPLDTSQVGTKTMEFTFMEPDSGMYVTKTIEVEISSDVKRIKKIKDDEEMTSVSRTIDQVLLQNNEPTEEDIADYIINTLGATTQKEYDIYYNRLKSGKVIEEATSDSKYNKLIIPQNYVLTVIDAYEKAEVEIIDSDYVSGDLRVWRYEEMLKRGIPMRVAIIIPSLLIGTLIFHFVFYNKKIVNKYITELYEINKFCGFLTYNLTYRNNSKVLIQETLASIDDGQFSRDFELIFFEKGRDMKDKLTDISAIYNYKFFEMYLRIANIIFDEGTSPETIKSLEIIQTMGDTYYDKVDLFFRTKEGAMGQIRMIIGISSLIPFIVKMQATDMFTYYQYTNSGYNMIIGFYLVELGLFMLTQKMYRNNKIIKQEGRYV